MADWLCSNARAAPCEQPATDNDIPPSTLYERMFGTPLLARGLVPSFGPVLGSALYESQCRPELLHAPAGHARWNNAADAVSSV